MDINCRSISEFIEGFAPKHLAEDWDNVGLLLGSKSQEVNKVMLCLDVISKVVDEAIGQGVQMIISHHPFIFKGLKKIDIDDPKGQLIYKLIKNDICVYSAHTNFDVADGGVNEVLAARLGLSNLENLNEYKAEKLFKLVVFVPEESIEEVRTAICTDGGGWIGKYSHCTFMSSGTGTFMPLEGAKPYIGTQGKLEKVSEYKLETIVPEVLLNKVVEAMLKAHPYEEVAYDIYPLEVNGKEYGMGKVGLLDKGMNIADFTALVKKQLNIDAVRVIGDTDKEIKKVAVFCGSFDGDFSGIQRQKADILVTGDIKYHTAVDIIEAGLCAIDAGHFNTEVIVLDKLGEKLAEKFPGLEIITSSVEKDPFKIT